MIRVINFSGGKTSALMTIKHYRGGDLVLFCDTGREHPKTYKFINDFEAYENIPIIRLSYPGGFRELIRKNKGVPNNFKRFCTKEMKVKTARRYLVSIGIKEYENLIGFRADEPLRVKRFVQRWKKVKTIFPLYTDGITKADVNEYWKNKPYTLEIPSILGNCTLCFMKGKNAIISILASYPELANEWIEDEEQGKHTYLRDISMKQMLQVAQNNLFKEYDLNEIKPAFDCACTS